MYIDVYEVISSLIFSVNSTLHVIFGDTLKDRPDV